MKLKRTTIINVIEGLGFKASFRTHALLPNTKRVVVEELEIGTTTRRMHPRIETHQARQVIQFVNSLKHTYLDTGEMIL